MKLVRLLVPLCLALFLALPAVQVEARPRCPKVWVEGHYNRHGHWVRGHWVRRQWVPGHHDHHGRYVPGHCR